MNGSALMNPDLLARLSQAWVDLPHLPKRISFGVDFIELPDGGRRNLSQRDIYETAFEALTVFEQSDRRLHQAILLVPPFSGGYPFMMRDVVRTFAPHMRVYVLEWMNARYACARAGAFTFDSQISAVARALETIGEPAHLLALCQGGVAALAGAASVVSGGGEIASTTLIAAPIKPRAAPSLLSIQLAVTPKPVFQSRMARRTTPDGGLRMVAPAEGFMRILMETLGAQDEKKHEFARMVIQGLSEPEPNFFTIASSLMDVPAEFFMDWVERIYLSPQKAWFWRGRAIELSALRDTPLLVIEGEVDAAVAPGQTSAALEMVGLGAAPRELLRVPRAGHFSLFHGERWRREIAPRILDWIAALERVPAEAN